MRIHGRGLFGLAVCGCALLVLVPAGAATKPQTQWLYLLFDPALNVWCRYDNAKTWHTSIDSLGATQVASVNYAGHHPRAINITVVDAPEAGDWSIYDSYTLNQDGRVISLLRETIFLPNDAKLTDRYERRNGKLLGVHHQTTSLTPGKTVDSKIADYPSLPVLSSMSELPFSSLVSEPKTSDKKQRACLAATSSYSASFGTK